MRLRELFQEGLVKQLAQDLLHLSDQEFVKLYGRSKAEFKPAAAPVKSAQSATASAFDLKRVPKGYPQPPWDFNTVKSYWQLMGYQGDPYAAYMKGYRGPTVKQPSEAVGDNVQAPWAASGARHHQMEAGNAPQYYIIPNGEDSTVVHTQSGTIPFAGTVAECQRWIRQHDPQGTYNFEETAPVVYAPTQPTRNQQLTPQQQQARLDQINRDRQASGEQQRAQSEWEREQEQYKYLYAPQPTARPAQTKN